MTSALSGNQKNEQLPADDSYSALANVIYDLLVKSNLTDVPILSSSDVISLTIFGVLDLLCPRPHRAAALSDGMVY